jgi:hypothetical protein
MPSLSLKKNLTYPAFGSSIVQNMGSILLVPYEFNRKTIAVPI